MTIEEQIQKIVERAIFAHENGKLHATVLAEPPRAGDKWMPDEQEALELNLLQFFRYAAAMHKRSTSAIRARISQMFQNGVV